MSRNRIASALLALPLFFPTGSLSAQDEPAYEFQPLSTVEAALEVMDLGELIGAASERVDKIEEAQAEIAEIEENLDVTPAAEQEALNETIAILGVKIEKHRQRLELALDRIDATEPPADEATAASVAEWRTMEQGMRPSPPVADPSFLITKGQEWAVTSKEWVLGALPGFLGNLVLFLAILWAFKIAGGLVNKIVRKALNASKLNISELLKTFACGLAQKAVMAIGLMIALSTAYGVDLGPLLAGIGVVGFVLGFALQETLSNFAAGLMILLYRPYDINDVISAGGVTGKVSAMSLVSTTLLTPDNQDLIVPNGSIWGGVITNITANATRRVDLVIGVGYDDDLDRSAEVLMEVISAHELTLSDPAPVVEVNNLGESSVDFVVRPWCKTSDYWTVYWDLTKSIKQRLDAEGISIPYPQRDLHLVSGGPVLDPQPGAKAGAKETSAV